MCISNLFCNFILCLNKFSFLFSPVNSNISFKLIMIGILIYMNSRCNKFIHQFYPYFKRAIRYKNGENILSYHLYLIYK